MEYLNAFKSVLAAMIGVQNKKNHRNDFAQKSAKPFIVVGIAMTIAFVLFVYTLVQIILNNS